MQPVSREHHRLGTCVASLETGHAPGNTIREQAVKPLEYAVKPQELAGTGVTREQPLTWTPAQLIREQAVKPCEYVVKPQELAATDLQPCRQLPVNTP
jgi:hypothetical protein